MVKRFVADVPRKEVLCAGSELSTCALRKVFSLTLFPINVADQDISSIREWETRRPIKRSHLSSRG